MYKVIDLMNKEILAECKTFDEAFAIIASNRFPYAVKDIVKTQPRSDEK